MRIISICLCLAIVVSTYAQNRFERTLKHATREKTTIDLFVRGDFDKVKKAVLEVSGIFKYGYRNYNAVTIPLKNLDRFLENPALRGVQNGEVPIVPLSDTAIIVNCVLPVHNGDAPLDTSYKGDGVIMGVIDYGIDITHEDFKKDNGTTRIRYIWDQNTNGGVTPPPYNYGREWTEFDINNGVCTHVENVYVSASHGTTVAGIAAGNGRACSGRYVGMAPNTDIIFVAINYQSSFLSNFADAVDYIFKKADAMGKPCVINGSFGAYWGSHDGRDFASQIIEALLEERTGRVLVCAAGNAGGIPFHLGYDVTSDTSFTWFKFNPDPDWNDVFFDLWADTQDFHNVHFAIGTDDPANWKHLSTSDFLNVKNDFTFSVVQGDTTATHTVVQRDSVGAFLGNVSITIYRAEGRYNINVQVAPPSNTSHYWSFISTGSGRIDGWNSTLPALAIEQSDMVSAIPDSTVRPDIVYYKLPDRISTITSSFTCSNKVITVGNFTNRASYADIDSNIVYTNATPGRIGGSSSHGPTRDNRIKPDISATGDFTLGSGNIAQTNISSGNADRFKVGYCGKYFRNGGTSMASPAVAGVAALYLQRNPNANWEEVKQAIITTARTDTFTGAVPNNTYGYGKVQACGAMLYNAVYGCMDSTADNYNAAATIDDGSCIFYGCTDSTAANYDPNANTDDGTCIIYGCMDSTAANYNPAATVDTGGCIIFGCTDSTALNYNPNATHDDGTCITVGSGLGPDRENISLEFVPNYFSEQSMILYDLGKNARDKASLSIANLLGQQVDEIIFPDQKGALRYTFTAKESGVFFYRLIIDNKPLLSGKIVVY